MGEYTVSKENWSLHRKGYQDQERHREKVQKAIKQNLPDLIHDESIILSNGRDVVKIPVRSLDEYKIRYNDEKKKRIGQGNGNSRIGDIIARAPGDEKAGKGKDGQAGRLPGEDYYEAEVSLMELEEMLFQELELPNLERKEEDQLITKSFQFNDVRKKGLMGNIDKKRTILSAFKRNALKGNPGIRPILKDDLRFKAWQDVVKHESKAVILAIMDTSGSMGIWEKFIARSFFFWMTRFLHSKYESVEIAFIAHHTEAKVVSEEAFFSKGESGGTLCSSAYRLALKLIKDAYDPKLYNIYPFHFSDGDNLVSDNRRCLSLVESIMDVSNIFGYGEINPYNRRSTLMSAFAKIDHPKFRSFTLKQKKDVYHAMKYFFKKESPVEA